MHVGTKKLATSGVLAAFSVLLIVLGAVIETSTLFFICGASFCVGIAIREWGLRYGFVFLAATTLVGLFVAPNKMYCITFAGMGVYLCFAEILWNKFGNKKALLWCGKYIIFNLMYVPIIIFAPQVLIAKEIGTSFLFVMWIAGQAGLFIYDKAHDYFQIFVWNKLRKYLLK
ncbi:MAG: hypothetical protein Q4B89_04875 [Lachnospiraceae bacterium]|nr:hypothetical protein [Lachnospiraceae bacterium]